jgi:GNAT superfamily N-acetyltransferase
VSDRHFPNDPGQIGTTGDGREIALRPMTTDAACTIGPAIAAIDPWLRLGVGGAAMSRFLAEHEEGARRYRITLGGTDAGICVVRVPWLAGPYLNLLGVLPDAQGNGVGRAVLQWLEAEARAGGHRNLWLCVSTFNADTRRIYEAAGYTRIATIDSLVFDGFDEHVMRKRLS